MKYRLLFIALVFPLILASQNDTLVAKNGDMLVGRIKTVESGIVTLKTSYSKKDFNIKFEEVVRLSIEKSCLVILDGGRRLPGYVRSENDQKISIFSDEGSVKDIDLEEVSLIEIVKETMWDRFRAYIDIGFNLTKANNNRQFNIDGGVGYIDYKWVMDSNISSLISARKDVEDTERTSFNAELRRILKSDWFLLGSLAYLSNTEQALRGRYSVRFGAGRYLKSTNHLYLGVGTGLNFNIEIFSENLKEDRESTELFVSAGLKVFELNGFNLNTNLSFYPGLSESGRLRADYDLNIKYNLPLDFYVKLGFQFNYDNQPAEFGSEFDYILYTGVGWKFD